MAKLVVLLSVALFSVYQTEQASFLEKSYIDKINQKAKTWKAGVNFDPSTSEEHIIKKLGSSRGVELPGKASADQLSNLYDDVYNKIQIVPKTFDARTVWKNCTTMGAVRDQGNCASSWAFGTSSAFADRLCVATNGGFNKLLSPEELAFCCKDCGDGCNGGDAQSAWKFFQKHGVVTGGDFYTEDGCLPYGIPPCADDQPRQNNCTDGSMEDNRYCSTGCSGDMSIDFNDDHRLTRNTYRLTYKDIQKNVMTFGPASASFSLYDDFPSYKSGVYIRSDDPVYLGNLTVKLIGWGEERGTPYWLMVNSWGKSWGDNGLFKIQRSQNECGVEDKIYAGTPSI